ncbi:hypothetical protein [Kitasatospora purpeofusca]|uniref:hypothetical protein n=1 Tax=Kitasatospora purpeofusca TaxID=67352 RepID=UPI003F4A9540
MTSEQHSAGPAGPPDRDRSAADRSAADRPGQRPGDRPGGEDARPSRGLRVGVAAVLVLLLAVVATVLLWPADDPAPAPPPPSPTATPTPTPTPTSTPTPTPTPTPTKVVPYSFFTVGTCLDHPQLSRTVTKPEARPCEGRHDGEAIADQLLPEGLTGDYVVANAMRDGCKEAQAAAEARQGGGGPYYSYPVGPSYAFYQQGWRDYTCILTAGNRPDTGKLTGHLR